MRTSFVFWLSPLVSKGFHRKAREAQVAKDAKNYHIRVYDEPFDF